MKGFFGWGFEILADFPGLGVHPAFHVADGVERAAVEHTLIMHEASRVVVVEELRHGENILARVALIAAGPDQDGGVVLSRSNMLRARSTTQSFHSGRLPGTFQLGSTAPSFCQLPWLSRFVSSIM